MMICLSKNIKNSKKSQKIGIMLVSAKNFHPFWLYHVGILKTKIAHKVLSKIRAFLFRSAICTSFALWRVHNCPLKKSIIGQNGHNQLTKVAIFIFIY